MLERQDAAFVLEQYGCIFAGLLDDLGVLFDGLLRDFVLGLAVEVAEVDNLIEHAPGGTGDGGFGDSAVLECLGHLLGIEFYAEVAHASALWRRFFRNMSAEHVHYSPERVGRRWRRDWFGIKERRNRKCCSGSWFAGHFHVEAGVDEIDRVYSSPVRGDEAFEADLVAEDGGQRVFITAGKCAVEAIVRTHDGRDVGTADGGVKRRYVDFMESLIVDVGVLVGGIVSNIVLDLGHDVLRLNALDFRDAQFAGEEGIFAEGVVTAAKLEVAIDIDEGLEGDVDAEGAIFAADDDAVVFSVFQAEGGGHSHGGSFAGGGMTRKSTGRSVRKAKTGNVEPRNAGEVTGLSLIDCGVFVGAVDQGELLFERHLT